MPRVKRNLVGGSSRASLPRANLRADEFGEIRPFAVAHARPDGALTDGASRVAVVGVGDDAAGLRAAHHGDAHHLLEDVERALVALPREVEHDEPEVSAQERAGGARARRKRSVARASNAVATAAIANAPRVSARDCARVVALSDGRRWGSSADAATAAETRARR